MRKLPQSTCLVKSKKTHIPPALDLYGEVKRLEKLVLYWESKAHEMALTAARAQALLQQHGLSLDGRG